MAVHHHPTIAFGLLLIAFALFTRYHVGKRRFNRKRIGGFQEFSSYKKALLVSFLESLINMLGMACVVAGLILVLIAYF